jgi:hypothetical protein
MLFKNTVHFIDYLFSIYSMYCIIFNIKILLGLITVKDIYSLTALMRKWLFNLRFKRVKYVSDSYIFVRKQWRLN